MNPNIENTDLPEEPENIIEEPKEKVEEPEEEEKEEEEEEEESEVEVYLEKLKDLKDLCKIIYDKSSKSDKLGLIKVYQISEDKFCYYHLLVISEFFEERGAPVISYTISKTEPKDFLYWNLIKNELKMKDRGERVTPFTSQIGKNVRELFGIGREVVFLIAMVEKLPKIIEIALSDTKEFD